MLPSDRPPFARPLTTSVAVGALVGCVFVSGACSKHGPQRTVVLEAGGVSVLRIVHPEHAVTGQGQARSGDWVIASKNVTLVVGDASGKTNPDSRSGAIVSLSTGTPLRHPLRQIHTAVQIEGAPVALRTTGVRPVAASPTPRLRVSQVASGFALFLDTDLWLDSDGTIVDAVTALRNASSQPIRMVRLGDAVAWPGGVPFAPRVGEVSGPTTALLPWFARKGETVTFALAFPDAAAEVEFKSDENGPIAQLALSPSFDVRPGATVRYRRFLIVGGDGGLGPVAELAWRRTGHPMGRVRGTLKPPPKWARVRALDPSGRTIMETDADANGRYDLPLPEGSYRLVLKASGGSDEQDVAIQPPDTVAGELIPPLPGQLRLRATDPDGGALPVRWVVRGIPPTQDPAFGPEERVIGSGDVVYTVSGEGSVEIRPGHYRVLATHGPEYSVDEQAVRVSVSEGALVRAVLERAVATDGWLATDLHLHAAPSFDSVVSLEDRVVAAAAEGVEFAVATDHNVVTDYRRAIEDTRLSSRLGTAAGLEVTTADWGHLNVFPYPLDLPPPPTVGVTPAQDFQLIRQSAPDALIQVNHPMFDRVGYFNLGGLVPGKAEFSKPGFSLKFDLLEVLNGFELHDERSIRRNLATWFSLLNGGLRYTATGNSDSHRLLGQFAGYARTYVRVQDDDPRRVAPAELFDSLRAGHATVSNGPFVSILVNGDAGPGDELSVEGDEVTLEISVRAPDWVDVQRAEVWANGVCIATQDANDTSRDALARIEWQLPLKLDRDSWFVVVAYGNELLDRVLPGRGALPFGFTNPVYVNVDGNGRFDASRPEPSDAKEEGPDPPAAAETSSGP
jgi:hypothetical protein